MATLMLLIYKHRDTHIWTVDLVTSKPVLHEFHVRQITFMSIFGLSWSFLGLFLWSPYVIGQTIIYFHPVVCSSSSFFLSFFPRLISAVAEWMSAILAHMVWP